MRACGVGLPGSPRLAAAPQPSKHQPSSERHQEKHVKCCQRPKAQAHCRSLSASEQQMSTMLRDLCSTSCQSPRSAAASPDARSSEILRGRGLHPPYCWHHIRSTHIQHASNFRQTIFITSSLPHPSFLQRWKSRLIANGRRARATQNSATTTPLLESSAGVLCLLGRLLECFQLHAEDLGALA